MNKVISWTINVIIWISLSTPYLWLQTNASSGMGVADHSKTTYAELQRKKVHRYVIFKIDEKKKEVVVEKTGGPAESYEDFTASLPENDCRYAVYDFDYVTSENCQKSKIFFIAWSPSPSHIWKVYTNISHNLDYYCNLMVSLCLSLWWHCTCGFQVSFNLTYSCKDAVCNIKGKVQEGAAGYTLWNPGHWSNWDGSWCHQRAC